MKTTRKLKRNEKYLQRIIVRTISDNIDIDILEKLLSNIRYNDKGCWIRGDDSTIYTQVNNQRAHRLSYELFTGRKLQYLGCHKCDTPACINPDHIFDGTTKDNFHDSKRKGRAFKLAPFSNKIRKAKRIDRYNTEFNRYLKPHLTDYWK